MGLRFFAVPVRDSSACEQELNGFLAGHKVVSRQQHLIDHGAYARFGRLVSTTSAKRPARRLSTRTCRAAASNTKRFYLPRNSPPFRGCEICARSGPNGGSTGLCAVHDCLAGAVVQRRCRYKSDLAQIEGIGENKID